MEKETTGVAKVTKEVIQQLKILNPAGRNEPFGKKKGSCKVVQGDVYILEGIVRDLNTQASAGVD